jgi:hypothetical protein
VLFQTIKVGSAIADRLDVTEGPVGNSGLYGIRRLPIVLALTEHERVPPQLQYQGSLGLTRF